MNNLIKIDGLEIQVRPDAEHEWLLTTAQVAEGYGVSKEAIRSVKSRHRDELSEAKHFFTSVAECNAGKPPVTQTVWTKRGVVRLGFFIRSERAKRFRDIAEDHVIEQLDKKPLSALDTLEQMVRSLREQQTEIELHDQRLQVRRSKRGRMPRTSQ